MDEAGLVDGVDGEDALGNVETGRVLGEGVVLDEQRHHVAAGQKLHDEVEILGVLEAVVELHYPIIVGHGKQITLSADVGELTDARNAVSGQRTSSWPRPLRT